MNLRKSARAALKVWDRYCSNDTSIDEYDVGVALNGVRSALAEPDEGLKAACDLAEARELIRQFRIGLAPEINRIGNGCWAKRLDDFLKRTDSE